MDNLFAHKLLPPFVGHLHACFFFTVNHILKWNDNTLLMEEGGGGVKTLGISYVSVS